MHPILNGYLAREIIARRQAETDAWRHSHRKLADETEPDSPTRRRRAVLRRLTGH